MEKEYVSLAIAIVGIMIQFLIAFCGVRRSKKKRNEALEVLEKAHKKRNAAITILEFAELWRQDMSDDQRVNLVIEWHDKLMEANVNIRMDFEL
jgi:hypothetical protein